MGGRASEIWHRLMGSSGRAAPKPNLIQDDDDEIFVSVAKVNVSESDDRRAEMAPSAFIPGDRLRRAGSPGARGVSPAPDPVIDWTTGDDARTDVAGQNAVMPSVDNGGIAEAGQTVPKQTVPEQTVPEHSGSDQTAPARTAPERAEREQVDADPSVSNDHLIIDSADAHDEPQTHDFAEEIVADYVDVFADENANENSQLAAAPAAEPPVDTPRTASESIPGFGEDPLPYRLRVLSGLHEGAELELDEGLVTIGGLDGDGDGAPADLTLADLSGHHQFTFETGRVLGPDSRAPMDLPCEIEVDTVRLWLEATTPAQFASAGDDDAAPESRQGRSRASAAGPVGATVAGLALSLAILGATIPLVSGTDRPTQDVVIQSVADSELSAIKDQIAAIAPGVSVKRQGDGVALFGAVSSTASPALDSAARSIGARFPVDVSAVATASDAADALTQRIAGGGLGDALSVERQGDVVSVSGALTEGQSQFWDDLQVWFDSKYAPTITLDNQMTRRNSEMASAPRIGLQAVWVGRDPYLIAADGRRSRPGDKLPGGWRVLEITAEHVRLSREGSVHDIQLAVATATGPEPARAELRQTETRQ